jgi:tRNA U55 pseudouridine synthase TruB
MPTSDLAPLIFSVILTLSVAGGLILRPLVKRLGDVVELLARERQTRRVNSSNADLSQLTDTLSRLTDRLEQLEQRQEFTEQLLASAQRSTSQPQLQRPTLKPQLPDNAKR